MLPLGPADVVLTNDPERPPQNTRSHEKTAPAPGPGSCAEVAPATAPWAEAVSAVDMRTTVATARLRENRPRSNRRQATLPCTTLRSRGECTPGDHLVNVTRRGRGEPKTAFKPTSVAAEGDGPGFLVSPAARVVRCRGGPKRCWRVRIPRPTRTSRGGGAGPRRAFSAGSRKASRCSCDRPRDRGPSGGSGIRTHGGLHLAAFQELCIRPLCHPSRRLMLGHCPGRLTPSSTRPARPRPRARRGTPVAVRGTRRRRCAAECRARRGGPASRRGR